jgi:magnesium chelatase subunit D
MDIVMLKSNFPFSAVVGQAPVKLALTLLAIDPAIGGVLVSGPRGSAKSTLARSLADLNIDNLSQLVTLPLGASEEMVTGTIDLQKVLGEQQVKFAPGLLSKAHKGLLYVDEVNLLPDALVDLLLDVAASGVNHIERDGISHQHEAEFTLMGTMNPDEGELRPQLLDRFGFGVALANTYSAHERVEIVRRRQDFDANPKAFLADYAEPQKALQATIQQAQQQLTLVTASDEMRLQIAQRCVDAQVDGVRGDLVWLRAALAHAALQQRDTVTLANIDAVEELVLMHRRNDTNTPNQPSPPNNNPPQSPPPFERPNDSKPQTQNNKSEEDWGQMAPTKQTTGQLRHIAEDKARPLTAPNLMASTGTGLHGRGNGRATKQWSKRINWFSSLIAGRNKVPSCSNKTGIDLRYRRQRGADPVMHLVLLDTSASTLNGDGQSQAKGLVAGIAHQAYLARQQLVLLGFGNDQVSELYSQGRAPKAMAPLLNDIGAGGGTPLKQAIQHASAFATRLLRRNPATRIINTIITDGRVQQDLSGLKLFGESILVDTEQGQVKRGRGQQIAKTLKAQYLTLSQARLV